MANIPEDVRDLLADSKYGITFPCTSGCQMRFIQDGKDYGGFYSYKGWGGVRAAVEAAISRNIQLRAKFNRSSNGRRKLRSTSNPRSNTGVLGVSKNSYYDKRREQAFVRYTASWRIRSKPKSKAFHVKLDACGDHHFHALRTALAFRKAWELQGDQFDPAPFRLWKSKRLYEPGHPPLPQDFWERTK